MATKKVTKKVTKAEAEVKIETPVVPQIQSLYHRVKGFLAEREEA